MFLTGWYRQRNARKAQWVAAWRSRQVARPLALPAGADTRQALTATSCALIHALTPK